jgi:2-keto-4-pentenoate hydratase/2-oxohepta-3-ene-1,7-dioic acid hydratase in catechol pathway
MRLANLDGRLALAVDGAALDVEKASAGRFGPSPQHIYEQWDAFRRWAATAPLEDAVPFEPERLRSPVPAPGQVIAVGLNYHEHVDEAGVATPEGLPPVFTKFPSSITGPDSSVELPVGNVDWEAELAVVIGRTAFRIGEDQAWDHVAGLTVAQDLSERILQMSGPAPQFGLAKSYPGFSPLGPWVVTLDEFDDVNDLTITCMVNDEIVQRASAREMIFPIPTLLARLSAVVRLNAGDVILTGTPGGVGLCRTPPRFLAAGDTVVTTIEGIGRIRQRMVAAPGKEAP